MTAKASRTTVGDTVVVENEKPKYSEPARLQLVQRYGSFDDPGPAALVRAMATAVGGDGSVYVYDDPQGIKKFSPDGDFSELVAREGAGPGEVGYVRALAVGPEGQVAAYDNKHRRVLVVESDGRTRVVQAPRGQPRYHEDAVHFSVAGSLRVGVNPPLTSANRDPTPRLGFVEMALDEGVWDSVFVPSRIWDRCPLRTERRYRRGFYEDTRSPYMAKATWALGPDGTFAIGCPDAFEFDIQRPNGTVTRVRWPGERVPLAEEAQEFLSMAGDPRYPEQRPGYARLILSTDGRVWVWPNRPMVKEPLPPQIRERTGIRDRWRLAMTGAFEVFDSTGTWIGTVPLPEELQYSGFPTRNPVVIRGDTIWGITYDSLGVNYVSRYRVFWDRSVPTLKEK